MLRPHFFLTSLTTCVFTVLLSTVEASEGRNTRGEAATNSHNAAFHFSRIELQTVEEMHMFARSTPVIYAELQ